MNAVVVIVVVNAVVVIVVVNAVVNAVVVVVAVIPFALTTSSRTGFQIIFPRG